MRCECERIADHFASLHVHKLDPIRVLLIVSSLAILANTAPVAQDIHLPGTALLSWFTVYYTSTGSSPGNMMVRFFDGGAGGGDLPVYPEGLIEEYALGQLQWLSSGFAWKTVELETPLWLPSHLWMEV